MPDGLPQAVGYVGTTQADPGAIYGDASDIPGYSQELNGLPSGLLCRDLRDRGYGYEQAYTYWELWGRPDNMDIDLNGTPCETVWAYNERNYEN